jgi:hypothetical protein
MKLAQLESEITKAEFEMSQPIPIEMTPAENTAYQNEMKSFEARREKLSNHRGQAYAILIGQCTHLLQDKMKQDPDWKTVSTSYNPLSLFSLIEKTILTQSKTQYPFATGVPKNKLFTISDKRAR